MAMRMTPDERRAQILEAVLPAVLQHGAGVTSRQLAEAAGVAEGTLFRSFGDKDTLLLAVLEQALDAGLAPPAAVGRGLEHLPEFIRAATGELVDRFTELFAVTMALGPLAHRAHECSEARFAGLHEHLARGLEPFAHELRVAPAAAAEVLVTLAFTAASHWGGRVQHATRDDIVQVMLYGLARSAPDASGTAVPGPELSASGATIEHANPDVARSG